MRGNAVRLLAVGVVLAVVTSGTSAVAVAAPDANAVKPVGTYQAQFPGEGTSSKLVITADSGVSTKEGTFKLSDLHDSGTWLQSGTTIALLVTNSTTGHFGRLFIGTLAAKGISAGRYTSATGPLSWSATRRGSGATATASAAPRVLRRRAAVLAAGSYTGQVNSAPMTLALKHDPQSDVEGTANIAAPNGDNPGVWIVAGSEFAMGLTVGDNTGDVFIGAISADGIGNGAKPGAFSSSGEGVDHWSADRNANCDATFTVDALDGSDTNFGTCTAPFKTLTKALDVATSGQTIDVEPGKYDSTTGETQPLVVPAGVTVIGDIASRGTAPQTQVGFEIVLSGAGSEIQGLLVDGSVQINGSNSSVLDSTVTYGQSQEVCITASNVTGVVLNDVDVHGCDDVGVDLQTSSVQFNNSSIRSNGAGIAIGTGSVANLGTKIRHGNNTLACNTRADLQTDESLQAYGDYWDHVPPTQGGSASNGIDIATFSATVNASFAMLAGSPCT